MDPSPRLPFSAVVGHDDVKLALILGAIEPAIGGVLLRGEKGSAKSTLARGLAGLLGDAPFVELPIGATEDRVVGSIDVAAALSGDGVRFSPGLLADAHGGVLYVDEVNLLPDHLVDVLLDVAASGVNRVEREGVSQAHQSRFVLVGSMNPEEGELRPQLLDRFGLCVDVVTPTDPEVRATAVARRLSFDAEPGLLLSEMGETEADLAIRLARARPAALPPALITSVSRLCVSVGAEGLRADLTICRAAAALAGWEGRAEATEDDVRRVAPFALAHRARRSPLDAHGEPDDLDRQLDEAFAPPEPRTEGESDGEGEDAPEGESGAGDDPSAGDDPTRVVRLDTAKAARPLDSPAGRRTAVEGPRGRTVGSRIPNAGHPLHGVAVGPTARAAAQRTALLPGATPAELAAPGASVHVQPGDLREPIRVQKAGSLVVFCVDASASMGAERRMAAAKGAVLSLLIDAYQRRDQVAVVTVGGSGAAVALGPTGSVEVAKAHLDGLGTGGRTDLAAGLRTALGVCHRAGHSGRTPLLVLVSDGRATAGPPGADPVTAALEAADQVRRAGFASVVVDVESGATRLGLGQELAAALGGRHLPVADLDAGALHHGVTSVLGRT